MLNSLTRGNLPVLAVEVEQKIRYFIGDARFYEPDEDVHLVVTSPPYFNYIDYGTQEGIERIANYSEYIEELKKVFQKIYRFIIPGGTICINITNMKSRKKVEGRAFLYPVIADVIKFMIDIGFVFFDEIVWVKGYGNNGALKGKPLFGSYPYPPTPKILDSIFENILIFKKTGKRTVSKEIKELSKVSKDEWMLYTRGIWHIEPDRKSEHPATFPLEIPIRLIKLYSFYGDLVYDPFAGSGTTLIASAMLDRIGLGLDINSKYKEEFEKKWKEFDLKGNPYYADYLKKLPNPCSGD
ncbi:MAG: site-specific DNA-methyltransferase [Nitrososphaeria archaeon]